MLLSIVAMAVATPVIAAPAGAPIRIGGTLALTGPLAPTALIHKIAGEIYVEELNKANGLLGRPVEWGVRLRKLQPRGRSSIPSRVS